jgi:predicted unusual protein kinase regulating ubiquinone biosynthesis (AarF/ABC1/UbiB family)
MLRASRVIASRAVVGLGGVTVAGGATATAYAYTEQGAGFRREAQFWSKIFPVVFDYYWKTAASSPRVKYIKWKTRMPNDNDDDDNDNNSERVWSGTKKELLQQLHETHAPDILDVMLDLKGLYVKLGQVLSVTALPIPEPYRVLFRTLQSDVPGWETFDDVVKPVLEKEFGRPLDQLFEYVDPIPCGAASIGQAHRARLLKATRTRCDDEDNHNMEEDTTITAASTSTNNHNREVIIKVQYPDAAWQVPADIQCVGDFLKICVWTGVVDESSARLSFEEFSRQFLAELDYERECQNLQEVYQSSLDPTAPYMRRHVIMPKVFRELCTKKVITMTYLPGPKLEAEARRQLALLGIDMSNTNGGLEKIVRDAAKEAENPDEPESGELVRRVTVKMDADSNSNSNSPPGRSKPKSPFSWKLTASRMMGDVLGVDSILWAVRMVRRLVLLSQAAMVTSIRTAPTAVVPPTWASWAEAHRTASAQAARLNLTKDWLDALFDVHGHQIFNLGLFNADPHPGASLIVEP